MIKVEKCNTEKPLSMKDLNSERVLENINCLKCTISKSVFSLLSVRVTVN